MIFALFLLVIFGITLYAAYTSPSLIRKTIFGILALSAILYLGAILVHGQLSEEAVLHFRKGMTAAFMLLGLSYLYEKRKG